MLPSMTYPGTKFEVAKSNGLGGDTFTRNVTDAHTEGQTDRRSYIWILVGYLQC